MTRQEAIEEIEEVLINKSKYTGKDCTNCDHWFGSFCGAPIKCQAEALYNAGYRKVDDVRKETAKEILQEWADDNSSMGLDNTFVKNIAKKYSVEVEE